MSITPQFGFVVTYVADVEAATRFYTNVLGLKVERRAPTFVQFDHFAVATDESMTGRGEPELYWLVDDAEAAFNDLSRTAEVTLPLTKKPFGTVFGVNDPDGHPRYLLQLAKHRPSQPV